MESTDPDQPYRGPQRVGLLLGPAVFALLLVMPAPTGLSGEGWRTAAVASLMAVWWMTEALPIPVTAMVPLAAFPLLGVLDMPSAAAPYAAEIIFLFMGGFFLAAAMERWGLHRRIALGIMSVTGTTPNRLILGFMLATAFLSMWISNTATAAMMLPIAMAVGEMFRRDDDTEFRFGTALMLGIAYASSIGGVATLIGTPPNAVLAAAAEELLSREIGFAEWMGVGVPVAAVMLPVTWLLLTRILFPPGEITGDAADILNTERTRLGPAGRGEKIVGVVFALTAFAWVMRAPKDLGGLTLPGIQTWAPAVRDSTIAMAAAISLFLLPVDWKKGTFALEWRQARRIPWGVLVLFGGGLSLARAMDRSGLASWIGGTVAAAGALPVLAVVAVVAALVVFLTEVTSNTATATMAMPVMAGVAVAIGVDPMLLMSAAALSASMAFMLPVATPPNAIVFGSGYLTIPQMSKAGFILNWLSILTVTLLGTFLIPRLLV